MKENKQDQVKELKLGVSLKKEPPRKNNDL